MTIIVSLLGGLLLVAVLLMVVSAILPDFNVDGFGSALTAAALVGLALLVAIAQRGVVVVFASGHNRRHRVRAAGGAPHDEPGQSDPHAPP